MANDASSDEEDWAAGGLFGSETMLAEADATLTERELADDSLWEAVRWSSEDSAMQCIFIHRQLAQCWASARMLAEWLIGPGQAAVTGSFCIELGAALGLPSLAASIAGAKRVLATDIDLRGQQAMASTIEKNRREKSKSDLFSNVDWRRLDWFNARDGLGEFAGKADVVICADAIYENRASQALAEATLLALRPGGVVIFASRHGRMGLDRFLEVAQALPPEGCGFRLIKEELLQSVGMELGLQDDEIHSIWHFEKPG